MTEAEKLIDYVERTGGQLAVTGWDKLACFVSPDILTPELQEALRKTKQEIIAALVQREAEETFRQLGAQGWVCWGCDALAGRPMVIVEEGLPADGLPPELAGVPVFTVSEVEDLASLGIEAFRITWEVKANMSGAQLVAINPPAPDEKKSTNRR